MFQNVLQQWIDLVIENSAWYFAFITPFFLVFWVWRRKRHQRLRIQKPQRATRRHLWHDLRYSVSTFFIFGLLDVAMLQLDNKGYSLLYTDVSDYGAPWLLASFAIVLFLDDTYFYWTHRAMHHPKLYRIFHKVHHESTDPSPLTSFAFHPTEAVVENFVIMVMPFLLPLHWSVFIAWQIFSMMNNVLAHLGYELYPKQWMKWPILKYKTVSVHHNMHHQLFHGNYALYFTWWDRWMGTEFKDYEQRHQQIFTTTDADATSSQFHKAIVRSKTWETPDMATFHFSEVPAVLATYKSGQHITFRVQVNGEWLCSTFSISSIPHVDEGFSVSVKRIPDGRVTPFLLEAWHEGQEVEVSAPIGNFVLPSTFGDHDAFLMIAGGSGITPIYSLMGDVLHHHPSAKVKLLFANRPERGIPFQANIARLQQRFGERLEVVWCARPTRARIEQILVKLEPTALHCYVCGPAMMADSVVNDLVYLGVQRERILREWFMPPVTHVSDHAVAASATARLHGRSYSFHVDKGQTLLAAALLQQVPLPHACQSGLCGMCKMKCTEGEVEMAAHQGLSNDERSSGHILTCQSRPLSPRIALQHPSGE